VYVANGTSKMTVSEVRLTDSHLRSAIYSGPLTYELNSFPRAGRNSRLFFPQEIMEITIMRSETPKAPLT
jgi:hypothetical protein